MSVASLLVCGCAPWRASGCSHFTLPTWYVTEMSLWTASQCALLVFDSSTVLNSLKSCVVHRRRGQEAGTECAKGTDGMVGVHGVRWRGIIGCCAWVAIAHGPGGKSSKLGGGGIGAAGMAGRSHTHQLPTFVDIGLRQHPLDLRLWHLVAIDARHDVVELFRIDGERPVLQQ